MTDKVDENRVRRMAERQNFVLQKSRRRDTRATDYGKYRIIAQAREIYEPGWEGPPFTQTLDEIESFLSGMDE